MNENKQNIESGLSRDLAEFFSPAYELFENIISSKKYIRLYDRVLDIGASDGKIEGYIDKLGLKNEIVAVDLNEKALAELAKKKYISIEVETICEDGNEFLGPNKEKFDLVIVNNTLHELNDPSNQAGYLDDFLENINGILSDGGRVILGDHYYSPGLTDDRVAEYVERQLQLIGHADPRGKFILPDLLKNKIIENGYEILEEDEVRVTDEIDKRYYVFVFERGVGGKDK